jgi:hypothetical protein
MVKHRNFLKNNEGGILSIDFLVGFTIFMVSFIMVVTLVSGLFIGLQSKTIDFDAVAYRTGVILAEDPGAAIQKVGVSPVAPDQFSWELIHQPAYWNSNILRMGFAIPKYYYDTPSNVWLENKNATFFSQFFNGNWNNDFYRSKLIFGDYPYSMNITVTPMGGAPVSIGDPVPTGIYYGDIKRVGLIKHPSSIDSKLDNHDDPDTGLNITGNDRTIHYDFRKLYLSGGPAYQVYPQIENTTINFIDIPPMASDPEIQTIRVCYPSCDVVGSGQADVVVNGVSKGITYPIKLIKSSMVLMGGNDGSLRRDVWNSTNNGESWTQLPDAPWTPRASHSSVALPDGSIVLMGGQDNTGYKNDVWRSADRGVSWMPMTGSAGWSARAFQSSVAMPDGSIVLMGGQDSSGYRNDVWMSTDKGATWTQMTGSPGWSVRGSQSSVAMPDGSIVLMGGQDGSGYKNDTWRSTDNGATWTQLTANAAWSSRASHSSISLPDGSIVLMGGIDGSLKNDVWQSTDNGATWNNMTAVNVWSPRDSFVGLQSRDKNGNNVMVVMGGNDGGLKNDVWQSTGSTGASWTQTPPPAPSSIWSARNSFTCVMIPEGSNVLNITPLMFQAVPNIGPLSTVDIEVTFAPTDPLNSIAGLDNYDPADPHTTFYEYPLTPAWLEVRVW